MLIIGNIEALIQRKNIRHLYISISAPGTIHVRAPFKLKEEFIRKFIASRRAWIAKQQERLRQQPVQTAKYSREEFVSIIKELTKKCEGIMNLKASRYTLRRMKSRWGSCNPKAKRISLSTELMKKPIECIEYVIVHELVHFLEKGHGERFKAHMTNFLPDWREQKKLLSSLANPAPIP